MFYYAAVKKVGEMFRPVVCFINENTNLINDIDPKEYVIFQP